MRTSDSIKQFAEAFVSAQAEMGNATLNKTNPHFGSKYADLVQIAGVAKAALHAHGFAIIQTPGTYAADRKALTIDTRLLHKSGEWVEGTLEIPLDKPTPQGCGSAITYGRRYALASICGLVSDEDDDGNTAERQARRPVQRETPKNNGNGKHTAKAKVLEAVAEWSDLPKDAQADAVRACVRAAGLVIEQGKALPDEAWETVLKWVEDRMEQGVDFLEATAQQVGGR